MIEILGLEIRTRPRFYGAHGLLWLGLTVFAWLVVGLGLGEALLGGLVAAAFHAFALVVHHYGHLYAGKQVGYSMKYVILWGLLGTDIYPKNEGKLSGAIHRRRAVGGAMANLLLSIVVALVIFIFYAQADKSITWVMVFCFIDTFGIFTVGAFIPCKAWLKIETDGDTFLKYWNVP